VKSYPLDVYWFRHGGGGQVSVKTKIEWATSSWSPIRGCTRVSEGCRNCWAERMSARNLPGLMPKGYSAAWGDRTYAENTPSGPRWTGRVELIESQLGIPLHWRKPRRIFVCSMSDTFHEALPDSDILSIFQQIGKCPQHTFLILTKRAERMRSFMSARRWRNLGHSPAMGGDHYVAIIPGEHRPDDAEFLPNVCLGVSVEDRSKLHRIDSLRETPAALRFLSLEPLLKDLGELDLRGIGWVIVGGESGPGARCCKPEWIRSALSQCRAAAVNCFVKQMGTWWARQENRDPDRWTQINGKGSDPNDWPPDLQVREMPEMRK